MGSRTHQRLPRSVSAPRLRTSAWTRYRTSRWRDRMSVIASAMSRRGLRSPAACRKAAGTSLVADIGRKSITSPRAGWSDPEEPVHEPVARPSPPRSELSLDESVVARQVESVAGDGVDDAVRVGDLGAD